MFLGMGDWAYHGMSLPWYDAIMKVDKMSISFHAGLGDEVRRAAQKAGAGLSSWLADAAAAKLRAEALREFLDDWETEQGALTGQELGRAEAELGLRAPEPAV